MATTEGAAALTSLEALGLAVPAFGEALAAQARGDITAARAAYLSLADHASLAAVCQHQLAVLAAQQGHIDEALDRAQRALALAPGEPLLLQTLANLLERVGHLPQAREVWMQLALKLQNIGAHAGSFDLYRRLISVDPLRYGAWANLGTGLARAGEIEEAAVHLFQAASLAGRVLPAIARFVDALDVQLQTRGLMLRRPLPEGLPTGALELFADVLTSLGKAMSDLGHVEQAVACHRMAVELRPAFQLAHWNLALALLTIDQYEEGWAEYEWRWLREPTADPRRLLPIPRWRGESPDGLRLMIYAEQGFGDTLQFAPLVKQLAQRAAHVVFQVHPSLVRLLHHNLGSERLEVMALPEDPDTIGTAQPLDAFAAQLSLPHFMRLTSAQRPLTQQALRPLPDDDARWSKRVSRDARLQVGLVWAGRPQHSNDANRSLPQALLQRLLNVPGPRWISLQIGARAPEFAVLAPQGLDLTADLQTFADTAALIAQLDLVIAVDTAVAHLAAAMGKTVWLLLPWIGDWRWGKPGERCAWYPDVRLFRQRSHGDWSTVIDEVCAALEHRCAMSQTAVGLSA